MRADGFSRCTQRMACRASSSAAEVTVQVLRTTRSAAARSAAGSKPLPASSDSSAAPSACVARHPKFCTKKRIKFQCDTYGPEATNWHEALWGSQSWLRAAFQAALPAHAHVSHPNPLPSLTEYQAHDFQLSGLPSSYPLLRFLQIFTGRSHTEQLLPLRHL